MLTEYKTNKKNDQMTESFLEGVPRVWETGLWARSSVIWAIVEQCNIDETKMIMFKMGRGFQGASTTEVAFTPDIDIQWVLSLFKLAIWTHSKVAIFWICASMSRIREKRERRRKKKNIVTKGNIMAIGTLSYSWTKPISADLLTMRSSELISWGKFEKSWIAFR